MRRTMYANCADAWLWRVTMDGEGQIDHRSPSVLIVAGSAEDASEEAMAIARQDWGDDARWLKVLSVVALHPVNGMAEKPGPANGTTLGPSEDVGRIPDDPTAPE